MPDFSLRDVNGLISNAKEVRDGLVDLQTEMYQVMTAMFKQLGQLKCLQEEIRDQIDEQSEVDLKNYLESLQETVGDFDSLQESVDELAQAFVSLRNNRDVFDRIANQDGQVSNGFDALMDEVATDWCIDDIGESLREVQQFFAGLQVEFALQSLRKHKQEATQAAIQNAAPTMSLKASGSWGSLSSSLDDDVYCLSASQNALFAEGANKRKRAANDVAPEPEKRANHGYNLRSRG